MSDPAPEWVEGQESPTDGLDLTGLRLPVDSISNYQLIGITTVTPRIRFLSIRAWIVKAFGESGLPKSYDAFAAFALNVETAIIIGILLDNRTLPYLPGIGKALLAIDEGLDPIPLERLVQQPAVNLYAGSSYNLLLGYSQEDSIPGLTEERGIPLATVFEGLISSTAFFRNLKSDPSLKSVAKADLAELGQAIHLEQISDSERTSLLAALLPATPAETWTKRELRRIGAYTLFLELANHHRRLPREDDIFAMALAYERSLPPLLTATLDGYLCYRIRDALAVGHEAVLGLVCGELGRHEGFVPQGEIIHSIVRGTETDAALRNLGLLLDQETIDTVRFNTLVERVDAQLLNRTTARGLVFWQGVLHENVLIKTILQNQDSAAVLLPVIWLLCQKRVAVDDLEEYPHLTMLMHGGGARIGLREVVFPQLSIWEEENSLLADVIAWLVQRTVDQHLRIAWSRMFADMSKDVALLLCDGELWRHRGKSYKGGRMDSRIADAIDWLGQLDLLQSSGLTEEGQKVLIHGYAVLAAQGGVA